MTTFTMAGAQLIAFDEAGKARVAWEGPDELLRGLEAVLAQAPALAEAIAASCGLGKPAGTEATSVESVP